MGTRKNKNAKIVNLRHPRKFKPAKIRARTVPHSVIQVLILLIRMLIRMLDIIIIIILL